MQSVCSPRAADPVPARQRWDGSPTLWRRWVTGSWSVWPRGGKDGPAARAHEQEQRLLSEHAELRHAEQVLEEAVKAARACGYQPSSPEMRTLKRAEQDHQHACERWRALLRPGSPRPPEPLSDAVIDLRDN